MKSLIFKKTSTVEVDGNIPIRDKIIPDNVRNFFIESCSRHITLAENDGYLWVASKHKAKKIKLDKYKEFKICFMKPAKGRGLITIQAQPHTRDHKSTYIADFGDYSDAAFESAKKLATELEPILGYTLDQDYWGFDC